MEHKVNKGKKLLLEERRSTAELRIELAQKDKALAEISTKLSNSDKELARYKSLTAIPPTVRKYHTMELVRLPNERIERWPIGVLNCEANAGKTMQW